MASDGTSTTDTMAGSIRKLPIFKRCQCLVSRYALALGRVQERIFEEYGQTEEQKAFFNYGFYDVSNLPKHHRSFCAAFAKCHERSEAPQIEEMVQSWEVLMAALKTAKYHNYTKDPESIQACQNLIKFIIGFSLLEAKYYLTLHCAWLLLRFTRFEDTTCWIICSLWAFKLGEWELLGRILENEKKTERKWPVSEGYVACVDCIRQAHRLATTRDRMELEKIVDELATKLQLTLANDKRTFLYSQAKSILRGAMVMASRLPNADLRKIDDPLYQRGLEMSLCTNVMRAYHPAYFLSTKSSTIQEKMKSAEEFMRLCSAFADYMETSMTYCWDCWDAGMLQEVEGACLSLWRNNMAFGSPYWTLRPLSLLFLIKSSTDTGAHLAGQYANCLQALLTPQIASTSYYLHTPKRPIRQSVFRRGSAVDDSFESESQDEAEKKTSGGATLDGLLALEMSSMNIWRDPDEQKEHFRLEAHVFDCECTFCASKNSNWALALELEWLTLLFRRFAYNQITLFQGALIEIRNKEIQPLRQRILSEVFGHNKTVATTDKVKTPNHVEMPRDLSVKVTPAAPKKRGRPPKKKPIVLSMKDSLEKENSTIINCTKLQHDSTTVLSDRALSAIIQQTSVATEEPKYLPPLYVHYWTRSISQLFINGYSAETSKTSVDYLNQAIKLCERSSSLLQHRATWLLLRHFQRTSNGAKQLQATYEDFNQYGHLFFREWRWRCCHLLARFSTIDPKFQVTSGIETGPWLAAHCHIESMLPSMRQVSRTNLRKRMALIQQISAAVGPTESNTANIDNCNQQSVSPICQNQNDRRECLVDNDDDFALFTFKDINQLRRAIDRLLPLDMTLVNLSMDEEGILWLTRCQSLHQPIVLRLGQIEKNNQILQKMRHLLDASDESVRKSLRPQNDSDDEQSDDGELDEKGKAKHEKRREQKRAKIFWEERKQLDKQMEHLCADLQSKWFSSAAPLLLPLNRSSCTSMKVVNKLTEVGLFTRTSAMTIVHLLDRMDAKECQELAHLLHKNDTPSLQPHGHRPRSLNDLNWAELKRCMERDRAEREAGRRYTLLVIPPALSNLPWECLPIFKRAPLITRIPSLHLFQHLLCQFQTIPRAVNGRNSFYLLNPGGDLANTQKRIEEFVNRFDWHGLVGHAPSRDQIRHALTGHDLFLYLGHGSGGRYFGRSIVHENDCRAVSILMGCSSVQIVDDGPGFDGRAILYDYLMARCPCVIGCLWLVTDGEIDRFFMAFMEYCFAELAQKDSVKKQIVDLDWDALPLKLFAEAMAHARSHCKLPYLTGASVVAYGLPVAATTNNKIVLNGKTDNTNDILIA